MHTTIIVEEDQDLDEPTLSIVGELTVKLLLPGTGRPLPHLLEGVGYYIRLGSEVFAFFKNYARRLFDTEMHLQRVTAHFLVHNHEHAKRYSIPIRQRFAAQWSDRYWRREVRSLLAEAWLNLAVIERMKGGALNELSSLEGSYVEVMPLFTRDYADDLSRLRRLDTSYATKAVQHMSKDLDNRILMLATLFGAISGAVVGGIFAILT